MHKTDCNLMICQSNNIGLNPLFFWAEFAAAKRGKVWAIQTFKTESFNRSFYLSTIVMFEVNCFLPTHVILLRIVEGGCESDVYVIIASMKCLPNVDRW
jgi:hypothetical protein